MVAARLRRLREDGEDTDVAESEIRKLARIPRGPAPLLANSRRSWKFCIRSDLCFPAVFATPKAALPAGAAVVEYGVIDDELFVCVVDGESVHVVRHITAWSTVEGAIRRVHFQMDAMRTSQLLLLQHLAAVGGAPGTRCSSCTRSSGRRCCHRSEKASSVPLVVLHGKLGAISFAALHDGDRYLGEQIEIAVAPSLAVAAQVLARRAPTITAPLVLADTQRLVHASLEASIVQQIFPDAAVRFRDDASIDSLRQLGPAADSIHPRHGVFRSDNPVFSALELADGNFRRLTPKARARQSAGGTQRLRQRTSDRD